MSEIYLVLEHTTRCDLDCRYCYNVWKDGKASPDKDLQLAETQRVFDNITSSNRIGGITHAGGEPLLNPDLEAIMDLPAIKGIPQSITTNGLKLDRTRLSQLADHGIRHVAVSLPAPDADTYTELCGFDALKPARRAILETKRAGLRCSVSAVLTQKNSKRFAELIELAAAFGADHFMINRFVPGGHGLVHRQALSPAREQLCEALQQANDAAGRFRIPVIVAIPLEHCLYDTSKWTQLEFGTCCCGSEKWVVDPYGRLRTCEQNPESIGSLLESPFAELSVQKEAGAFRARNLHDDCADKPCYTRCGGGCRFARPISSS